MLQELIIFKKDTDAIGTNRGFVFQYLKTLIQWLTNYRENADNLIYCEVEDDIKQVDQSSAGIKWTQVKCYASVFNLSSEDIHKTLYNFFVLFAIHDMADSRFSFESNSKPSGRDDLFNEWISKQPIIENDMELLAKLVVYVQQTLSANIEEVSGSLLKGIANKITTLESKKSSAAKKKDKQEIDELKVKYQSIERLTKVMEQKLFDIEVISDFIKRIEWVFDSTNPQTSIQKLIADAKAKIKEIIPKQASANLYFNRLLSEIFLKSTEADVNERILDTVLMNEILGETEEQLKSYTDQELVQKLEGIETTIVDGFSGVNVQLDTIEKKLDVLSDNIVFNSDVMLIDLPQAEKEEIEAILSNDSETQSKLVTKINKINFKSADQQDFIIDLATELRCRYLLFIQKLKLENLHQKREEIKNLETLVKVRCTNIVTDNDEMDQESYNPRKFWRAFQDDLKLLLVEVKQRKKIDIDETIVFAQMYQMAAECHLRWHNEG